MAKQGACRHRVAVDNIKGGGILPHDTLDLGHLDQQTFGDQTLQHELLALFAAQAPRLLAAMRALRPDETRRRADLAHQLKGSALAIGAFKVAAAAEGLGAVSAAALSGANPALAALEAALAEAATAIDARLRAAAPLSGFADPPAARPAK